MTTTLRPITLTKPVSAPDPKAWYAALTGNPLTDAFPSEIATHPGLKASPVAPDDMPSALNALLDKPRQGRTTAYFNIPFCETRCLYCLFYVKPYRNEEESRLFADALIREMALWADKPAQSQGPVHAVYFGGGTPTALEADDIRRILEALPKYLPLANDCEITFEGRLSNFGPDKMEACLQGGVNRFSLGVQSFDTKIRQAMGRRSPKDELIAELERLMSYNQAAVVVDLIYGFPFQTMETWEEDLRIAMGLGLDGIDCYQLRVFPSAPLARYIENGKLPAGPDHALRAEMFARSVEMLSVNAWRRLSISHWASSTRERNFYNYFAKTRSDCLAFGPGAGGVLHGQSYMLTRKVDDWMAAVNRGEKPIAALMNPTNHWAPARMISEQMELNWFNPTHLAQAFPSAPVDYWNDLLTNWVSAGLMHRQGDFHHLTVPGQFWQTRMTQGLMEGLRL